jgi:hypothetical protein
MPDDFERLSLLQGSVIKVGTDGDGSQLQGKGRDVLLQVPLGCGPAVWRRLVLATRRGTCLETSEAMQQQPGRQSILQVSAAQRSAEVVCSLQFGSTTRIQGSGGPVCTPTTLAAGTAQRGGRQSTQFLPTPILFRPFSKVKSDGLLCNNSRLLLLYWELGFLAGEGRIIHSFGIPTVSPYTDG